MLSTQTISRIAVSLTLIVVVVGAYWGRRLQRSYEYLIDYLSYFGASLLAAAVVTGLVFALIKRRRMPSVRTVHANAGLIMLTLGIAVVFAAACESLVGLPIERMHFIKYGSLGFFLFFSQQRKPAGRRLAMAASCAAVAGICEESAQLFIPERIFDFHDIRLNITASVLGACFAAVVSRWRL